MSVAYLMEIFNHQQAQRVAELAKEIWSEHFTPIIGRQQVEYMIRILQSADAITAQLADGYRYFYICRDEVEQGYVAIQPREGTLFLSKLYIRKACRGQGLARMVLNQLEQMCRQDGYSSIWLHCNKYNESSLRVYARMGFEIIAEDVADIGGGFVADDFVLQKVIDVQSA